MRDDNGDIIEDEETEAEIPFDAICRQKFLTQEEGDDSFDPVRDIKWVFMALGVSGLKQSDAPSTGAWRLLHEVDSDPAFLKSFYNGPLGKLLTEHVKKEKDSDRVDDEREEFRLIDRLLREPDDLAPILSDLEKRARKLALSRAGVESGV